MSEDAHDIPRIVGVCSRCSAHFDLTIYGIQCPICSNRGVSSATNSIDIETRAAESRIPHILTDDASKCREDCCACELERTAARNQAQIAVLEELWRLPDERTRLWPTD